MPSHVEKDDIRAAAELGLTEARNSFDGRPGVQFKTFAYYRIRGAVYDAIRKATWFSRDQYKELSPRPRLTITSPTILRCADPVTTSEARTPCQLGRVACYMLSLDTAEVEAPASRTQSPKSASSQQEWHARLHGALAAPSDKHRSLLQAYYFEDKNLEEIGASQGLSKSWVAAFTPRQSRLLRQRPAKSPDNSSRPLRPDKRFDYARSNR